MTSTQGLDEIIAASQELVAALQGLRFGDPITHTYNPLDYAWAPHELYLRKFAGGKKRVLMMGMNPGPFGMAQTGVPFGEVAAVSDWMGVSSLVSIPDNVHPKRPIEGFGCPKSEVSGRRLWGYFAEKYPDPADFFAEHYVTNYCPLVWMAETGRNITPDKVKKAEIAPVEKACNTFLATLIKLQEPEFLIGVGAWAETMLKKVVKASEDLDEADYKFGKILHPSPASPIANRGWAEAAGKQLVDLGIWSDP